MGRVILQATVSVDGFIADPTNDVGPLFDWFQSGDIDANYGDEERDFKVSLAQRGLRARHRLQHRRLCDRSTPVRPKNGWSGRPAAGDAVFVVTHQPPNDWPFPDAPFTFVTDGVSSAIRQARQVAGDRDVSVMAGDVGGQVLAVGLVDEIRLDLAPIVLGRGVRFFGEHSGELRFLENPRVIEGNRITHLIYELRAA